MKRLIYFLAALFIVSCSTDGNVTGIEYPNVNSNLEKQKQNPIAVDGNGEFVYQNDSNLKERFENLYPYAKWVKPQLNLARNNGNGKGGGKKVRAVKLSPQSEPGFATQAITNVMRDPVTIPDTYTQPLPEPIGQFAVVDWNGDGIDDEFEIHTKCYWPRSFSWVTVNGETINNSIAVGASILGFDDVNGDGTLDVLLAGGNHRQYNAIDGINNGPTEGEITEPYSPYNVGYNVVDETPSSIASLLDELVVVQDVNNPDFVRWDLGHFINGVSQYEAYAFHVMWREVDPVTLEFIPGTLYLQTVTYGEWGIGSSALPVSGTVWFRFTNADYTVNPDECIDKEIYVTY